MHNSRQAPSTIVAPVATQMRSATLGLTPSIELSLCFQLPPRARALLEVSKLFTTTERMRLHETRTYFDTPYRILNREGLNLDVCQSGRRRIQTLSRQVNEYALATSRMLWEWQVDQSAPDARLLDGVSGLAKLSKALHRGMEPVFSTNLWRVTRVLRPDRDTVIKAALIHGDALIGAERTIIRELHLVLVKGTPQSLYQLADTLTNVAPLEISPNIAARHEQTFRHSNGIRSAPPPAQLGSRTTRAGEALREILSRALYHLVNNISATLRGAPEGVHQMRMSIRSARATLRLFRVRGGAITDGTFDSRLRSIGAILGLERDWNVFCLDTLPTAIAATRTTEAADSLRRMATQANSLRLAAKSATICVIRDPLFTALVLQLATWAEMCVTTSSSSRYDHSHQRLSAVLPKLLNRVARTTLLRARHLGGLSTDQLHRIRKSVRRLGIDVANLASVYPRRSVKPYQRGCDDVLTILGSISDTVVTRRLARLLVVAHPKLRDAAAIVIRRSQRQEVVERHRLRHAIKTLHRASEFWL